MLNWASIPAGVQRQPLGSFESVKFRGQSGHEARDETRKPPSAAEIHLVGTVQALQALGLPFPMLVLGHNMTGGNTLGTAQEAITAARTYTLRDDGIQQPGRLVQSSAW